MAGKSSATSIDGGDTQLQFPVYNSSKTTFSMDLSAHHTDFSFIKIIKEDVKKAWEIQPVIIHDLEFLPRGGGYAGDRYVGPPRLDLDQSEGSFLEPFASEWMPHVASYISWEKGYSIAIICDTYRRLTLPEFQTPEHMKVVYVLALAADMITNRGVIVDDFMDNSDTRNQRDSYHVARPLSFMNDGILLCQMAILLIRKHIPDNHPAKEEILAKSSSMDHQNTYYFLYHSRVSQGINHISKYPPCPGSEKKLAGNPEKIPIHKIGVAAYYELNRFRAFGYLRYLIDLGRLAACYTSPNLDLGTYCRTVDLATQVICLVDDIIDYSKEQVVSEIRHGEIGSHIAILMEIVNYGYPDCVLGEEVRFTVSAKEINEIQGIVQKNFATGKDEDALKIMEFFNKFNVKRLLGAWLESEIEQLDKLVNSSQGKKLNTGWIRATILETGFLFQIECNKDEKEKDKEFYAESPEYFKGLLLGIVEDAKRHNPNSENYVS